MMKSTIVERHFHYGGTSKVLRAQDPFKLLAVDSDTGALGDIRACLTGGEIKIATASSGAEAIRILEFSKVDLVILDIQIRDIDGLSLLQYVREQFKDIEVIMTASSPSVPDAVRAIKGGAENYLAKPLKPKELLKAVERLVEKLSQRRALLPQSPPPETYGLIGISGGIRNVIERIERAAAINAILYQMHTIYQEKVRIHLETLVKKHKWDIDHFMRERQDNTSFLADIYTYDYLSDSANLAALLNKLKETYGHVFSDIGVVRADGEQVWKSLVTL